MGKLSKERKLEKDIDKLVDWAQRQGYDVYMENTVNDVVNSTSKEIEISTRQNLENQLYSLAHECGHVLLYNSKSYEHEFPHCYKYLKRGRSRHMERRKRYKVELIREETEAWRRGSSLLRRLNCFIDEEKISKLAAECVFSYMEEAVNG